MKKIGVHHIDFSINEKVEKKFLKKAFVKFGAVALPMHMAMWNISFNLAINSISLIYFGGKIQQMNMVEVNKILSLKI